MREHISSGRCAFSEISEIYRVRNIFLLCGAKNLRVLHLGVAEKGGVGLVAAGHFAEVIYLISKTDLFAMGMRVLARGSVLCEGVTRTRERAERRRRRAGGREGEGGRFVQRVWLRWQLLPPPRLGSRRPRSPPLLPSPRWSRSDRKGCNSLLARSGSGGGRGDYSPRSRFADDDKRESADPIVGPTRSLFSPLFSRIYPFSFSIFLCFFPTIRTTIISTHSPALFSSFTLSGDRD